MPGTNLFPDIPEEIRACRIGSCINSLARSLMPYAAAFDTSKLNGAGLLRHVHGTGQLVCQANSSSSSHSDSSFFAMDSKAEAKFFGCAASAGFSMARASKEVTNAQRISCYVSYVYKGQKLRLLQAEPETLYQCTTEDFRRAYERLMNAKEAAEYLRLYNEFTRKYGHGCVTALHLTAGSAFEIDIQFSSTATSNTARYGASVAANSPYGGAAVASNWGKEVADADAAASVSLTGQNIPEDAPTAEWCQNMMQLFLNVGVAKLSEAAQRISPPTVPAPKAPELPKLPKDRKKIPLSKANDDFTNDLKNELVDKAKYNSWNDYVRAQKKAYENLTAENVVNEAQSAAAQGRRGPSAGDVPHRPQDGGPEAPGPAAAMEGTGDVWDLGGYMPFAYEITPWSDLFPDLKLGLPQSFASVYIAKLHTFYLTRLQFAQYLYFLSDVGPDICGNDGIAFDAARYVGYCDRLRDDIARMETFDEQGYLDQIGRFEGDLANDKRFHSKAVYDTFFNNYKVFSNAPCGFIFVLQGTKYLAASPEDARQMDMKRAPRPLSIAPMLEDAVRDYPLIRNNGESGSVFFLSRWIDCMIEGYEEPHWGRQEASFETDDQGNKYLKEPRANAHRFYAVEFADIPPATSQDGGFYVRGLPMFDQFPFAKMREFARPPEW